MKKFVLILFVCLWHQLSHAQFDVHKLNAGVTMGYAKPLGDFSDYAKGGFAYQLIVSYDLSSKLEVGLEYAAALTAALDGEDLTGLFGLNIYGLDAVQIKSWYTFSEKKVSPYAGIGIGLARFSEPDVTINDVTVEGSKRSGLGGSAELGLKIGGFRLGYAYLLNGKTSVEPVFNSKIADLPVSYHRFVLGYVHSI